MRKQDKQKIKMRTKGQKGLKTCKNCGIFLKPFADEDYCSNRCEKQSQSIKDVVLNE